MGLPFIGSESVRTVVQHCRLAKKIDKECREKKEIWDKATATVTESKNESSVTGEFEESFWEMMSNGLFQKPKNHGMPPT